MRTFTELNNKLINALQPVIDDMSNEELQSLPILFASLAGRAAKLANIYSEATMLDMVINVAKEGFHVMKGTMKQSKSLNALQEQLDRTQTNF